MAEFPNIDDLFTLDPTFTQAHARPMMEQWQRATMQLPGGKPPARLVIANDSLSPVQSAHIVDTEGESPVDDVQTIVTAGIHDGCILELLAADSARIVTLKHAPEQLNGITLAGGADKALDTIRATRLQRVGDFWFERPLGANLSDVLDGERRAADGVGASEWALAQVNDKAEEAGEAAAEAMEAAKKAADEAALPLFSLVPCPTGIIRPGFLFPHLDNGLLTRGAFPDAYDQLAADAVAGSTAILIGDDAWQAEKLANGGVCPRFMLDEAAETFRIPFTPGLYQREPDPGKGTKAGDYQIDTMRPITGSLGGTYSPFWTNMNPTGALSFSGTTGTRPSTWAGGADTRYLGLNSALLGPNYSGDETRPVTAAIPQMIKMYGAVLDASEASIAALIQATTEKLDASEFEVSQQVMHVQDQKPANTHGGSFTAGGWRTRDLNTVATNTIPGASLASNRITLPAGVYDVFARAPAQCVDQHIAQLYSITESLTLLLGSSATAYLNGGVQNDSLITGRITLASAHVLEIRHISHSGRGTDGFGFTRGTLGVANIYSEIFIRRLA